MPVNPYEKYKQQTVMTMTQGEMLLKLYDEALKQLNTGVMQIDKNDIAARNKALQKAQRIITHLRMTLDFSVEISSNLDMLYDFFIYKITQSNLKNQKADIEDIIPMVSELREAFAAAERATR